jgi:uncharacterized membrane protein
MTPEAFLTPKEESRIVTAIKEAEHNTSGEIRVHLESKNKDKPTLDYVLKVFQKLGMTKTKAKNGVFFYVDTKHRNFIILGDEGINKVVPENFWKSITEKVTTQFKQGNYAQGLIDGIEEVGIKLKNYFPYQSDDINELPDEISKN